MTNTVSREARQQTAVQMIQGFRAEMRMDEKAWYKFCLRYSERNVSTVVLFFEDMFEEVPYGFVKVLRGEMNAKLRREQVRN